MIKEVMENNTSDKATEGGVNIEDTEITTDVQTTADEIINKQITDDNKKILFLSCTSCNHVIAATHGEFDCVLLGLNDYMKKTFRCSTTNLFAFTCCYTCDKPSSICTRRSFAKLHFSVAKRHMTYEVAQFITCGELEIAVSGHNVAFIDRDGIQHYIKGNYTLGSVQYYYTGSYTTPDAVVLDKVYSGFLTPKFESKYKVFESSINV